MTQSQINTSADLERQIHALGHALWEQSRRETPSAFQKEYWVGKVLDWTMDDVQFKIDMFRLIDVLPVLGDAADVSAHVKEYLLQDGRPLPTGFGAALKIASGKLTERLGAAALKRGVEEMAHRFIAGSDTTEALPVLRGLHDEGIGFTLDLLGEATLSDSEADAFQRRYMDLIDAVSAEVSDWPADDTLDRNHLGPVPRANVSLKITALEPHLDPVDPDGSVQRVLERVKPILLHAREKNVFVNFDMEQWEDHEITMALFETVCRDSGLKDWPHLGIVVQAYLRQAERDVDRLLALAKERGTPITIRLVKGAYWDYEVVRSNQHGYPLPVFDSKSDTDANYERVSARLLAETDHLVPAFGSHNLRSLCHAMAEADANGVPKGAYEIQMLFGMAEPMRQSLHTRGYRVRVYVPVGDLLPGMAYLVRRLLENTSNEGFLRQSYHERVDLDTLLQAPPAAEDTGEEREQSTGLDAPFRNCAHWEFAERETRDAFAETVRDVGNELPFHAPVVVAGKTREKGGVHEHVCPNDRGRIATRVVTATRDDADAALNSAGQAWPEWRDRPLRERAELLDRLADRLEDDRLRLAAIEVHEVGKPWREADADVTEAIDFCRYYARQALEELGPRRQGNVFGEVNTQWYEGRGPAVIIAPWNFPMAILCGMTTAAAVAGNTVVMKPAEQSSATAYALYRHMIEAGFPKDVVHFLPGIGEEIGSYLVSHPLVAQIAFTGSKAVGLSINQAAGVTHPSQRQVKRVVCEMGGKNAILVDDDADFDEVVVGVLQSAFAYAGQKCSACSRLLVVERVYDPLMRRLVEACKRLAVAPATAPDCQVGPVIDEDAYRRLIDVLESPGDGATELYRGDAPDCGFFVPPTLFRVDDPHHRLMQEELFGPVVAVMPVESFEKGLQVANATPFGLTGGVFTRRPSHLSLAEERFRVGNLYLNRNCTGAMVSRQPFGGFGMSGIGTKAGGPGYLRHFADPRCVTENTMRRGFSPEVST